MPEGARLDQLQHWQTESLEIVLFGALKVYMYVSLYSLIKNILTDYANTDSMNVSIYASQ